VRLSSAPFVEGIIAGLVCAASGATLDQVDAEARGALAAKAGQLGVPEAPPESAAPVAAPAGDATIVTLVNPDGLHARPAAMIVQALGGLDAALTVVNRRLGGAPRAITGPTSVMALAGRRGDDLELRLSGADAAEALHRVQMLIADGFGEMDEASTSTPAVGAPAPPVADGPLGVSAGRAVGPVIVMTEPPGIPDPAPALALSEREAESARLAPAAARVATLLRDRAQLASAGGRAILEASAELALDAGILADAEALVRQSGEGAARAIALTLDQVAAAFAGLGGRMAERVSDVRDIRGRLIAELTGQPQPGLPMQSEPFVLLARDLAPADTALLDPATCRALVTEEGGPTSHTAILARSLGIPAVVAAAGITRLAAGTVLLVDGGTGELVVDPSAEQIAAIGAASAVPAFDGTGRTRDGHAVALLANVGSPASVDQAVAARAQGVGLFRTEFCFLDRTEAPTVDEQVEAYRVVFRAFPGRNVIVRTLDAGADKPLAFVPHGQEENPALGVRGFRTARRSPELLTDQLTAIALAAAEEQANVSVMAPMISTAAETATFVRQANELGLSRAGVMVETPSAALTAAEVLQSAAFVSLGTNDLAQYTMAADRQLGELAALNDPWQPAVLRLIAGVAEAGIAASRPVGVCGEAAADPLLAAVLVGLGVTSLSMTPRAIAGVAALLTAHDLEDCQRAARAATASASPAEARTAAAAALAS